MKLIRHRQRAIRFRGKYRFHRGVHAPALAALYDVSDPGKISGSHRLSPVFCPDWAFAGP
jgi:hypothetical protein